MIAGGILVLIFGTVLVSSGMADPWSTETIIRGAVISAVGLFSSLYGGCLLFKSHKK